MEQSILKSTKKILNVDPEDDAFDLDILTHINSAFSHLHELGIGPNEGFVIEDDTAEWDDFLEEPLNVVSAAKTNLYLKVRLMFDPPATAHVLTAFQQQLEESDARLSIMRESSDWKAPEQKAEEVDPVQL